MPSHPDKVKATVDNTIEEIQNRFVELTKAYKAYVVFSDHDTLDSSLASLTDETIRENLEKYGHPDGRQDISMGIALPHWIVERKNNIWVLGIYGLLFGGALPALVVRIFCSVLLPLMAIFSRVVGGSEVVKRPRMVSMPSRPLPSSSL